MEEKPLVEDLADPFAGECGHPIPREIMLREIGFSGPYSRHSIGKKIVSRTLATKAVHTLVTKDPMTKRNFQLPAGARTTFNIGFSPDGSKVASCHGDHNVYVCEVSSGKLIQTLSGHPRTPWCVVFHPTQNDILASGCLAGHVRVWDLNGGSETLVTDSGTVIASLAFHPTVRLLAVATFNEIIFWDWGRPYPLARCSTENTKEKVRLVRFDRLGLSLITGITNFPTPPFAEEAGNRSRAEDDRFSIYPPQHRPNILRTGAPSGWHREPYPPRRFTSNPMDLPFPPPGPQDNDPPDPGEGDDDDPDDGPTGPGSAETVAIAVALATVGDPDAVADDLNDRQERFQESYRQLVNHYQDLVSHYQRFLRNRIPSFLEQRQARAVPEPSDPVLIANDPFLPMSDSSTDTSPETSNDATPPLDIIVRANPSLESPTTVLEPLLEGTGTEDVPLPIVIDDEVPGPSRLMHTEPPILDNWVDAEMTTSLPSVPQVEEMEVVEVPPEEPLAPEPVAGPSSASAAPAGGPRSSSDLQSIEALAQNILEMQNLCSRARQDAPLTIENQHIVELQNIRRHLEVLQEQTRDLQSSIRQTLTSLARGSFDALRSRIVGELGDAADENEPLDDEERRLMALRDRMRAAAERGIPPRRAPPNPSPAATPAAAPVPAPSPSRATSLTATSAVPATVPEPWPVAPVSTRERHQAGGLPPRPTNPSPSSSRDQVVRITFTPRVTSAMNAPELGRVSPPGPYMLSNAPPASRSRVPPVLTMHYDIGEGYYRTRIMTNSNSNSREPGAASTSNGNNPPQNNEPVPGPSRDFNLLRTDPYRRIFREYHIFGDHRGGSETQEHSRFCPFSGRDGMMARPPPRMRCITEMGEEPILTVWPNAETGQSAATRSFRSLTNEDMASSSTEVAIPTSAASTSSTAGLSWNQPGSAQPDRNNNTEPQINFPMPMSAAYGHIVNGGPTWINNDVGVGVYLTVRNFNDRINALRADRDFLRVERDQLLRRRATITNALTSASSTGAANPDINSEDWQRHFNAGLGLVPPNVREGQRQSSRRRSRNAIHSEGNLVYTLRHGFARPIPLRPSPWDEFRTNMTNSQPAVEGTYGVQPPSRNAGGPVNAREVPAILDGNFRRGFSMRNGDEYTPVYSHITMTSPTTNSAGLPDEVRDSPQQHVYAFPIGLFLEGSGWLGGTQSIGIYYPPVSREEEESLREFRRTENLIPLVPPNFRPSVHIPRYRVEYDQTHLRIMLPRGFSLTFIQPGLTLLDAVTTLSSWARPRPTSGRVYILHVAPFLDAVERLFSHRMRRGVVPPIPHHPASRIGSMYNAGRGYSIRTRRQLIEQQLGQAEDAENIERNEPVQIETVNAEMYSRQLAQRIHRLERLERQDGSSLQHAVRYNPGRFNFLRGTTWTNQGNAPSTSTAPGNEVLAIPTHLERHSGEPFEVYRRRVYHTYVNDLLLERNRQQESDTNNPGGSNATAGADAEPEPLSSALATTRRTIRLAVDTTNNDVWRNTAGPSQTSGSGVNEHPNRNIARAIESRIERVLNERGNRGLDRYPYVDRSAMERLRRAASSARNVSEGPTVERNGRLMQWASTQTLNVETPAGSSSSTASSTENEPPSETGTSAVEASTSPLASSQNLAPTVSPSAPLTTAQNTVTPPGPSSAVPLNRRRSYSRISLGNSNGRAGPDGDQLSDEDSVPERVPRLLSASARGTTTPTSQSTRPAAIPVISGVGRRRRSPDRGSTSNAGPLRDRERGERLSERHFRVFNSPYGDQQIIIRRRRGGDRYMQHPGAAASTHERRATNFSSGPAYSTVDMAASSARTRAESLRQGGGGGPSAAAGSAPTPAFPNSGPPSTPSTTRVRINFSRDGRPLNESRLMPPQAPTINLGMNHSTSVSNNQEAASVIRAWTGTRPLHTSPQLADIPVAPRARPPTYYTMDATTTAFLSSRIQKWDFSEFLVPDIRKRDDCVVVRECALHSDACLDISSDSDFLAVLQPSENGSYSGVGIYSLRDESLGDTLYMYQFDQNTVSISISPSCDYIVVGYAGRGPLYRFVHPHRHIGQIISVNRDGDRVKLVCVKELFADSPNTLMSINCMHWVPVPGYGIIYGTNTGELVLLS